MKKKVGMATDGPDRLNVIVEGSKIVGDFIAESNVRIDGEIQGNVTSSSKVVVGSSGLIKGNLVCCDADVEGRIEGTLKVEALLTLRSNANVTGEISTDKIQIEEGAQFSGECKMNNFSSSKPAAVKLTQEENVIY
jgi:cytoskeletal protein CcmA (bactofilin family)